MYNNIFWFYVVWFPGRCVIISSWSILILLSQIHEDILSKHFCSIIGAKTLLHQDLVEWFDVYCNPCLWLLSVQVLWCVKLCHWTSGSRCSASMLWLHLRCQAFQIGCWRWRQCVSLTQEPLIQWHSVTSDETRMLAYVGEKTRHLTLMAVVWSLFTEANRWTLPYDDTFHCRHVLTTFTSLAVC
jgi:hypothetical protein